MNEAIGLPAGTRTSATPRRDDVGAAVPGARVPAYNWYAVWLLAIVYAVHTMDRGVLTVLLQPIKHEFLLSDTQLGFLAGMAYALAYAFAAIPLGLLTDRVNRRNLLVALILIWSLLTAFAGMAGSFVGLVLIRLGVGLAEAGGQPTSLSIISDYIPRHRRAAAASIFMSGTGIGSIVGLGLTGAIASAYGWRAAFFVVGLPGVLIALLVFLTLREPRRGAMSAETEQAPPPQASFGETIRFILSQKGLLLLLAATGIGTLANAGIALWIPSLLVRAHGFDLAQAGFAAAGVSGLAIILGSMIGAFLFDRYGSVNLARQPVMASAMLMLAALAVSVSAGASNVVWVIIGLSFWSASFSAAHGVSFGLTACLVPAPMRGVTLAILALINNLIGYGLGPQIGGVLSDLLEPSVGTRSLSYALIIIALTAYSAAALLFMTASRRVNADVRRVAD